MITGDTSKYLNHHSEFNSGHIHVLWFYYAKRDLLLHNIEIDISDSLKVVWLPGLCFGRAKAISFVAQDAR